MNYKDKKMIGQVMDLTIALAGLKAENEILKNDNEYLKELIKKLTDKSI